MQVVMLRVGIDTGSGGIHGPLFRDQSFEYVPIPDGFNLDSRTYGNTVGRRGQRLVEYFPKSRQSKMVNQSIHFDPEFETFTYGDPARLKAGLRRLEPGDMLIFYCGLEGWDLSIRPGLYLMGYFEILRAGWAEEFGSEEIETLFRRNFHVRHRQIFEEQRDRLVLVKGNEQSRLLNRAVLISTTGRNRSGRPIKILSPEIQRIFGDFGGKTSFQRSPPRWVDPAHVDRAVQFMRSLV